MQYKANPFFLSLIASVCLHIVFLYFVNLGSALNGTARQPKASTIDTNNLKVSLSYADARNYAQHEISHTALTHIAAPKIKTQTSQPTESAKQDSKKELPLLAEKYALQIEVQEQLSSETTKNQTTNPVQTDGAALFASATTGTTPFQLPVPLSMLLTWPADIKKDALVHLEVMWINGKPELSMVVSSGYVAFDAYAQAFAKYQLENETTQPTQQQYLFTVLR
jgi:hypothetical protein